MVAYHHARAFPVAPSNGNHQVPPTAAAVGSAHDSVAPVGEGGKVKTGGSSEAGAAAMELERESKAREDREKLKEARKVAIFVVGYSFGSEML